MEILGYVGLDQCISGAIYRLEIYGFRQTIDGDDDDDDDGMTGYGIDVSMSPSNFRGEWRPKRYVR